MVWEYESVFLMDILKLCSISKAQRSQIIIILSLQAKNSSRFMHHVGQTSSAWMLPLSKFMQSCPGFDELCAWGSLARQFTKKCQVSPSQGVAQPRYS